MVSVIKSSILFHHHHPPSKSSIQQSYFHPHHSLNMSLQQNHFSKRYSRLSHDLVPIVEKSLVDLVFHVWMSPINSQFVMFVKRQNFINGLKKYNNVSNYPLELLFSLGFYPLAQLLDTNTICHLLIIV